MITHSQHIPIQCDALEGHIRVNADCGDIRCVGSGMSAGTLEIIGSVGDDAGVGMSGGTLIVHGNAGRRLGGLAPGARCGMTGGTIIVHGNCGDFAGHGMRRGLIAVGGNCGEFAGTAMIAGTIIVLGSLGARAGAGMKRGTIYAQGGMSGLLPTFSESCEYLPTFLEIYFKHLRGLGLAVRPVSRVRRYCGDGVALGLGEILTSAYEGVS